MRFNENYNNQRRIMLQETIHNFNVNILDFLI